MVESSNAIDLIPSGQLWLLESDNLQQVLKRAVLEVQLAPMIRIPDEGIPDNHALNPELHKWLYPDEPRLTYREAVILAYMAESWKESRNFLRRAMVDAKGRPMKRLPSGRPVTGRQAGIRAYVLHVLFPKLSWPQIVYLTCTCPKKKHDKSCVDNVYKGQVRLLKRAMGRLEPIIAAKVRRIVKQGKMEQ